MFSSRRLRTLLVPIVMVLLGITAFGIVAGLQARSDRARAAQSLVGRIELAAERLAVQPHIVSPSQGFTVDMAEASAARYQSAIKRDLAKLRAGRPPAQLEGVSATLRESDVIVAQLFAAIRAQGRPAPQGDPTAVRQLQLQKVAGLKLGRLTDTYIARAKTARLQATLGTLATVLSLLAIFAFFYFRSVREQVTIERLLADNHKLLAATRDDALTDALTGLNNRRALSHDLAELLRNTTTDDVLLALFDLDGFKQYNDTFGHAAGDELLTRLGRAFRTAAKALGAQAYRLGGDEFCLVTQLDDARLSDARPDEIIAAAREALSDEGDGWTISASVGAVQVPADAADVENALVLADERMYADKADRKGQPSTLQALSAGLKARAANSPTGPVSAMATVVAKHLGLAAEETETVRVAADLHDIGKSAIPDSILAKQGELDDDEWAFIRHHTITGGRLAYAAHARANTAALVRSSHEHFDGSGYPDGLAGSEIPLGARIIAVCDAFNAMTSERPFRTAIPLATALGELEACAGSQFDPQVVAAFLDSDAGIAAARPATATSPTLH